MRSWAATAEALGSESAAELQHLGMQDWNDKQAMRILASIRQAIGTARASLLLVEVALVQTRPTLGHVSPLVPVQHGPFGSDLTCLQNAPTAADCRLSAAVMHEVHLDCSLPMLAVSSSSAQQQSKQSNGCTLLLQPEVLAAEQFQALSSEPSTQKKHSSAAGSVTLCTFESDHQHVGCLLLQNSQVSPVEDSMFLRALNDLHMMVQLDGAERTLSQWRTMLHATGFKISRQAVWFVLASCAHGWLAAGTAAAWLAGPCAACVPAHIHAQNCELAK